MVEKRNKRKEYVMLQTNMQKKIINIWKIIIKPKNYNMFNIRMEIIYVVVQWLKNYL